jgi:hypothetical protein
VAISDTGALEFAWTRFRGDTMKYDLVLSILGQPVNLTGRTVRFTAKLQGADADDPGVFQLSSPAQGIVITNALQGLARLTILPALTRNLPLNAETSTLTLDCDIQVSNADGTDVETIARGTLTLLRDITITAP